MAEKELEASVVLPTYNRRDRLARVLQGLERQTVLPSRFEVVVVDDGSTDGTPEFLASVQVPFKLKVLRQQNSGPARARNAGLAAAERALVVFLDDDVEPLPELLAEHLSWHEREQDVVVIGPLASLPSYPQPWIAWEQKKLEQQYTAMTRGEFAPTYRQFWTGNASVAREHLVQAGGFNPEFLRAEDVELGLRLHKRGLGFRFNSRARGLHHAERPLASWENAQRSYGQLEVRIFDSFGENTVVDVLQNNWQRLHPATRWVVSRCLSHPQAATSTAAVLRSWLTLSAKAGGAPATERVCSVFANLLYWTASIEAMGPRRADEVLGSDAPKRTGNKAVGSSPM